MTSMICFLTEFVSVKSRDDASSPNLAELFTVSPPLQMMRASRLPNQIISSGIKQFFRGRESPLSFPVAILYPDQLLFSWCSQIRQWPIALLQRMEQGIPVPGASICLQKNSAEFLRYRCWSETEPPATFSHAERQAPILL